MNSVYKAVVCVICLAVLALAAITFAADDPIIGTWKLNLAKSRLSLSYYASIKRAAPKEKVEIYRKIEGDQIELSGTEIGTDGSSRSGKRTWA